MAETFLDRNFLVVELASVLAGPAVGQFFAELGATVVKIENFRQGGDITRSWKLASEPDGDRPAYFSSVNWGKFSAGIDLTAPEGREAVYALLRRADAVILSYKPGDAAKLGMEPERLLALNPRLVAGEITAYGPADPRTGYDAVIQAESGFMYMNGTPDSGPVKMPVALMDLLTAHQLKEAMLLALWRRERTGKGSVVRVSLYDSAVTSLANQALNFLKGGVIPQRLGSGHPNIVPYGDVYLTADGKYILYAVGSDRQFADLCSVLGINMIAEFATNRERVRHREQVNAAVREATAKFTCAGLLLKLEALKVPCGAVRDLKDVFDSPQSAPLLLTHSGERGLRTVAFIEESREQLSPPPALGADTADVLHHFAGLSPAQIQHLKEKDLIF